MTISNKLRYYNAGMAGAPSLSAVAGSLIALLDAVLVNGFDSRVINTLTVSGGVANAQISGGHVFEEGAVVRVAGVTGALAALNGDWRVASATGSALTWSVAGLGIADGSATGTITALRAPAGWEKIFSASGRAAYRSLNYASEYGRVLYVDDTGTTTARVWACASMTDIDTPTGRFPTEAQQAGGYWWGKANDTTGTRYWHVAADAKRFAFAPEHMASAVGYAHGYGFGRLAGADADPWATIIYGASSSANALHASVLGAPTNGLLVGGVPSETAGPIYIERNLDGTVLSVQCAPVAWANTQPGSSAYPIGSLSTIVSGAPVRISHSLTPRGVFPGPSALWWYLPAASVPARSMYGVPGNGSLLLRYNTSQVNGWLLHLGQDGRWD